MLNQLNLAAWLIGNDLLKLKAFDNKSMSFCVMCLQHQDMHRAQKVTFIFVSHLFSLNCGQKQKTSLNI